MLKKVAMIELKRASNHTNINIYTLMREKNGAKGEQDVDS